MFIQNNSGLKPMKMKKLNVFSTNTLLNYLISSVNTLGWKPTVYDGLVLFVYHLFNGVWPAFVLVNVAIIYSKLSFLASFDSVVKIRKSVWCSWHTVDLSKFLPPPGVPAERPLCFSQAPEESKSQVERHKTFGKMPEMWSSWTFKRFSGSKKTFPKSAKCVAFR